ncbi:MAG: nucleoside triphosphate pyrophosphohydrolase [Acidobacteriota bacterium]|nr:nucleoside triphosphate pyrophosphohydrolase [Acidobacteriota bacterium]MDH3524543.1 nucleoside triphosphate pyrophosphohydrolase [Acidobacteriota bacterium]
MPSPDSDDGLRRLVDLVARLRAPGGCPWDREQQLPDLRAYLLEEAHETAAAIDRADWDEIAGELGDLLFQVAFLARLGEEAGELSLAAIVERIEAKMIARHPHVFGDAVAADAAAVRRAWERRKAEEATTSLLEGVPESLPALALAFRMTQKAAGVGFDWAAAGEVLGKLREEVAELEAELGAAREPDRARLTDELGDVLFTAANVGRHLGVDPEAALARANRKFRRRFARVEALVAESGASLADCGTDDLERRWLQVKEEERASSGAGASRASPDAGSRPPGTRGDSSSTRRRDR